MFPDFKELLYVFNAHQVRYLVVGGYAVSLHAQPRATKDLDILISPDPENSRAVFAALAEFGAPLEGLSAQDFTQPANFFRMGAPPVMVDIMPRISGVDFGEAWQRRVEVDVDDTLTAPFISRQDLLAAKVAAGRPQDLADAAALREAEEHVEHAQQQASTDAASQRLDDIAATKRKGHEEWLRQRQAASETLTPDETRAKARAEWLKLRNSPRRESDQTQSPARERDLDQGADEKDP